MSSAAPSGISPPAGIGAIWVASCASVRPSISAVSSAFCRAMAAGNSSARICVPRSLKGAKRFQSRSTMQVAAAMPMMPRYCSSSSVVRCVGEGR